MFGVTSPKSGDLPLCPSNCPLSLSRLAIFTRTFQHKTIVSAEGSHIMSSGSPQTPSRRATPSRRGRQGSGSATDSASAGHYTYVSDSAPEKPPETFTSSLSIAVEGTAPSPTMKDSGPIGSLASFGMAADGSPSRRTPRKSKVDALAAINRSRSPSVELFNPPTSVQTEPSSILNVAPISVTPTLDMTSVKTISPRNIPTRTKPRPFGLEEVPTFFPSPEEFKDPMGYIRSISSRAQDYGLVKVVPPIGWNMPFVTDTEVRWYLLPFFH